MTLTTAMPSPPDRNLKQLTLWLSDDVMVGCGIDQVMPHPCSSEDIEGWVRDSNEYVNANQRLTWNLTANVMGASR